MDAPKEEMGFCRDALLALLDFLVDPLLPSRSTLRESISLSQQESVAKQMHAVVLLYNYYHRKQHPSLAFLEVGSLCERALDLKPSLHLYLGVPRKTDNSKVEELEKDLTLTEEAIISACETSKSLDASKNNPIIDGWPISKVAVFLVDSRKENCVLFHSSITQGVWSVIEKEVDVENQGVEDLVDSTSLQELAYLAVKETCGINEADLKIVDNHSVYSTSKPKTTVRLYIMQCTITIQNMNLVPINDVMESVQGSLVDKESVTPVVEYFHLLPFADNVLDCLKSDEEISQDSPQHFEATKEDGNHNSSLSSIEQSPNPSYLIEPIKYTCNISEQNCTILDKKSGLELEKTVKSVGNCRRKDRPTETLVYKKRNRLQMNNTANKISCIEEQCEATGSSNSMDINGKKSNDTCQDVIGQKLMLSVQHTDQAAQIERAIDVAEFPDDVEKASSNNEITETTMSNGTREQDDAFIPFDSHYENLCKMQMTIDPKDPSVSKTINFLLRKRLQLSQEIRKIADELAVCEANIQTILRGGEDSLAVKIESLVNGCNEISPLPKRKRLSEAILNLQSPFQELDGICSKNFWMLPNYIISPLEDGFQATVIVKGVDFECSSEGTTCDTPLKARNSAASKILEKLRSLVAKS